MIIISDWNRDCRYCSSTLQPWEKEKGGIFANAENFSRESAVFQPERLLNLCFYCVCVCVQLQVLVMWTTWNRIAMRRSYRMIMTLSCWAAEILKSYTDCSCLLYRPLTMPCKNTFIKITSVSQNTFTCKMYTRPFFNLKGRLHF